MGGGTGADSFYFLGDFGNDSVDAYELGVDAVMVGTSVASTVNAVGNTVFNFFDGNSIMFIGVTLTSADLVFV